MLQKDKKMLGIGMVGGNFMGKAHSNAYSTIPYIFHDANYLPKRVVLGALTVEEATAAADRFGYERGVAGYKAVVSAPDVDVVDVCVHDAMHKDIALAALQAGKHVLCEKPLAVNLEEALIMARAAREAEARGQKAMCGFNYRFVPAVRLAKKLIEEGVIGKVYSFNGAYNQEGLANPEIPYERVRGLHPDSSGTSYNIGSHILDMSRFLMGEIVSVMGEMRTYNATRPSEQGPVAIEKEEEAQAIITYQNGSGGLIKCSNMASGRKNQLVWEINGSLGSMTFDMEDSNILNVYCTDSLRPEINGFTRVNVTQLRRGHPFMEYWWPQGHGTGWEHAHINEIAHFLDCIVNDKPLAPYGATFADGYRAALATEAIRLSSKEGRRVMLSEIDELGL